MSELPGKAMDFKEALEPMRIREFTNSELMNIEAALEKEEGRILTALKREEEMLSLLGELEGEVQVDELRSLLEVEVIEKLMHVEDLKALTVDELLKLEADQPGILLFAFTSWGDRYQDLSLEKVPEYLPEVGDELRVDFRGNMEAYYKLGAAHLLPESVTGISVEAEGKPLRVSQKRVKLGEGRVGFYDDRYMSVFSGDLIRVESVGELKLVKDDYQYLVNAPEQVFEGGSHFDDFEKLEELHGDLVKDAQNASEYFDRRMDVNVSPEVILSVIAVESGFNPEAVNRSSGCSGLGQFAKITWKGFMKKNRPLVRSLIGQPVSEEFMDLRFNAKVSVYATTWYLARLAQRMGESEVDETNIDEIYMAYHEGFAGKQAIEAFLEKGTGKLYSWQKKNTEDYYAGVKRTAENVRFTARAYKKTRRIE